MPISCTIWFNKLQPWDAKVGESILISRVQFEPAYPEDLDFFSPGPTDEFLRAFVVDGNREDVDESAISIRVGVIVVRRDDHDVRSCAKVDGVRTPLEVVRCVVDA